MGRPAGGKAAALFAKTTIISHERRRARAVMRTRPEHICSANNINNNNDNHYNCNYNYNYYNNNRLFVLRSC
jgi:hypothetical protein